MQGDAPTLTPQAQNPAEAQAKRITARGKFKAHGDNPTKLYQRRFTDYQVKVRAEICRQRRLCNRTTAEMAFSEMLYESEAIFLNGDRFILADFYLKAQKLVIEIDGSAQDDQKE